MDIPGRLTVPGHYLFAIKATAILAAVSGFHGGLP
jgi:hypothetical protein